MLIYYIMQYTYLLLVLVQVHLVNRIQFPKQFPSLNTEFAFFPLNFKQFSSNIDSLTINIKIDCNLQAIPLETRNRRIDHSKNFHMDELRIFISFFHSNFSWNAVSNDKLLQAINTFWQLKIKTSKKVDVLNARKLWTVVAEHGILNTYKFDMLCPFSRPRCFPLFSQLCGIVFKIFELWSTCKKRTRNDRL